MVERAWVLLKYFVKNVFIVLYYSPEINLKKYGEIDDFFRLISW